MARKDGTDDLRIKRTQKSIKEAFFDLSEKVGFEHISVKDITDYAGISRNTFYLHYSDKYDLLNRICDELMRILFFRVGKQLRRAQRGDFSVERVAAVIKLGLSAVEDNKRYYKILLSDFGADILLEKISQIIRLCLNLVKNDIDMLSEYSLEYIVDGMTGVIRYCVMHNVENTENECLAFTKIHLGSIINAANEKEKRVNE